MSQVIQAWRTLSGPGRVGVCLGAIAIGSLVPGVAGVAASLFEPAPSPIVDAADLKQRREKYESTLGGWVKQADGRTLFFRPAKPPPPPEPPPPEPEQKEPPPPPPPAAYEGPGVAAIVNGEVWFTDGTKRKAGDAEESGLQVLAISEAPWSVRLKWNGVEFDVPVFARDTTVIKPPEPKPADESKPTDGTSEPGSQPQDEPEKNEGAGTPGASKPSEPPPAPPVEPK